MVSVPSPQSRSVAATTLYLDHVAATVMAAMAKRGLRPILLKGGSFHQLLFEDHELRGYSDVDLLVSPGDIQEAGRLLEESGFEDTFAGAAPSETSPFATEFRSDMAVVDLHSSLPGLTVSDQHAWVTLSAHAAPMTLSGVSVDVLEPAARCLHVVLNAASDGQERSREDLRRAVQRLPPATWQAAQKLAHELGALPSFATGLGLIPEGEELWRSFGLEVDIPTGVSLRASAPPPLAMGLDRLLVTPGIKGKAFFVARRLFPTPSGLRYWLPLARRGTAGMALAYVWRPFHLLLHSPAALAAWRRARDRSRRANAGRAVQTPPR